MDFIDDYSVNIGGFSVKDKTFSSKTLSDSLVEKNIKKKNAKNLTDISFEIKKKKRKKTILNQKRRQIINVFSHQKNKILFFWKIRI